MNLIVTDHCNRSCPYCFAREKVALAGEGKELPPGSGYISLENVETYLDFIQKSGLRTFKILGGEPTLHPDLPEIVKRGLDRGLDIKIFTNGLWPKSIREYFIAKTEGVAFIVNVNEPHLQTEAENRRQHECLKIAAERAALGFNIYRMEFDLLFTAELIETYNLKRDIRLGLASPIARAGNEHLADEELKMVGRRLASQLRELEKRDIIGMFDCGFTLCMFDEEDLGSLVLTTQDGFSSSCHCVIDVGPDLSAWHCFPLSEIFNVSINDFNNADEINAYYFKKLAPIRDFGSTGDCFGCKHLRRGQCTGGCLGRIIRNIESHGDSRFIEKLEATL